MSLPEPPPNVPRIVDAQDPGTGHYVVMVRMPTQLAAKFPDKAWGTPIDKIGLSKQDSDKFPGYTLVDIEPLKGSPDLYWIFQKLDGPVWTTKSKGKESLVPAKFRRFVTSTRTKQEVAPQTEPSEITGDLIQSVVEQQDDSGKAVKVNTEETIDENADPMVGGLTDTWGVNTISEQLVTEGDPIPSGFGVKSGRVTPLGDGKSVMEVEQYPADLENDGVIYTLTGREVDEASDAVILVKKSLVDASRALQLAAAADGYAEIQPLDKWHSIMIVSKIVVAPSNKSWKETREISLPNKLVEVGVIWDSDIQKEGGTVAVDSQSDVIANKLGWSASVEASVVGSVFGRPYTKVVAGYRGAAEVTVVRTYHTSPPDDAISAHRFSPVYGTLTIHGVQGMRQARGSARGLGDIQVGSSVNYRRHMDRKMAISQFGPFEFAPGLSLTEVGDPKTVSDTASGSAGSTPGPEHYPAVGVTLSLTGTASLELPPSSTPLSSGATFILSVDVSPWRYGYWVKEVRTAKVP